MTRKSVVLALILLVAASIGAAKEKSKKHGESGGWGFFGPYAGMFNFDSLNAQLHGLPFRTTDEFGKNQLMFGGGGIAVSENITIGGYGFGGHQTVSSDTLQIQLQADYGGGMFELGWMPLTTPHFKIGPALGLGGAGFTLRAAAASGHSPRFDSLLQYGSPNWEISNSSFTLAPAVNIMVPISWAGIYLKVGYFLSLFDKTWKANSSELASSSVPKLSSSGPFAALQIMLGGSSKGGSVSAKAEYKPDEDKGDKNKGDQDKENEDKGKENED